MDSSAPNISTGYHPEGSDARPKDTLDREVAQPASVSGKAKHPVVDDKGRPLNSDGLIESEEPVLKPSKAEAIYNDS